MKKLWSITALAVTLLLTFASCEKEDHHHGEDEDHHHSSSSSMIITGTWKVILYNDNGTDETNHYSDYGFIFSSGGAITATNSSSVTTGTWNSVYDDSQMKLELNFGTSLPFQELNNDWHIIEQNNTIIRLEDVSGGSGGTDYLTFEKL